MTQVASQPPAPIDGASAVEALEQRVESLLSRAETETDLAGTIPGKASQDHEMLPDPTNALEASIDSAIEDAKAKVESITQTIEAVSVAGSAAGGANRLDDAAPPSDDPEAAAAEPAIEPSQTAQAPAAKNESPAAELTPAELLDQAGADVVEAMFGTSRAEAAAGEQTPAAVDSTEPEAAAAQPANPAAPEEPAELIDEAPPEVTLDAPAPAPAPAQEAEVAIATPVIVHAPPEARNSPATSKAAAPAGPSLPARLVRVISYPVAAVAGLIASPLRAVSVEARDLIGWFALVTAFNAACLWAFVLWKSSHTEDAAASPPAHTTHHAPAHAPEHASGHDAQDHDASDHAAKQDQHQPAHTPGASDTHEPAHEAAPASHAKPTSEQHPAPAAHAP